MERSLRSMKAAGRRSPCTRVTLSVYFAVATHAIVCARMKRQAGATPLFVDRWPMWALEGAVLPDDTSFGSCLTS